MGSCQRKQAMLGKERIGPALMIRTPTSAFLPAAAPQNAAEPHPNPSI
jgi:hypothetical protein